ncbi:uncharacterized protein LOC135386017 [Ornithodoros turicata]|uniref:uncharacterized protein LOC135386017 n=1 Tax=Ornithodoros turicata TaxID=34597 RepID=UPI003139D5C6
MSAELEKLIAAGRSLGVPEGELRLWVNEQVTLDRERKAAEREARAEERTARAAEREAEERLLLAEERVLSLRAQVQASGVNVNGDPSRTPSRNGDGNGFRPGMQKAMPVFDEKRDDLDAYLHRFEVVASGLGWPRDQWATALSLSLAGEALAVFGRLSAEDSNSYEKLSAALLQSFRYTPEGFREKFRSCVPDKKETAVQFGARLSHLFDKWVATSKTTKDFKSLRDLILREQFVNRCTSALAVFLKEGECNTLDELCQRADWYLEAQGLRGMGRTASDPHSDGADSTPKGSGSVKPPICVLCGRAGHKASDCRVSPRRREKGSCWTCGDVGHHARNCGKRARDIDKQGRAACVSRAGDTNEESPERESDQPHTEPKMVVDMVQACGGVGLVGELPSCVGFLGGRKIEVLRDTGSNMVLVRRSLVAEEQLTGDNCTVYLADNTQRSWPEARIDLHTPYLEGIVSAYCVDRPLFDVMIGNVPGVRTVKTITEPPQVEQLDSTAQGGEPSAEGVAGVVTRGQTRQARRSRPPLKVPECMDKEDRCFDAKPGRYATANT